MLTGACSGEHMLGGACSLEHGVGSICSGEHALGSMLWGAYPYALGTGWGNESLFISLLRPSSNN
eukprot:6122985-Heterocapsa_arctica.AAC.1